MKEKNLNSKILNKKEMVNMNRELNLNELNEVTGGRSKRKELREKRYAYASLVVDAREKLADAKLTGNSYQIRKCQIALNYVTDEYNKVMKR